MAIIEVKTLLPQLVGSIPIGIGTTAICFLKPSDKVLKIFYNSSSTKKLFDSYNMQEHLEFLSTLGNETYCCPQDIYVKDGKVLGYSYPYIYMKTIDKMPAYTTYLNIISDYRTLLHNTRKISEKKFRLYDVHQKNVLFGKIYRIIDIDKGNIEEKMCEDELFNYNMRQIIRVIIEAIFNLNIDEHLTFQDELLQRQYIKALYEDPVLFYELTERLFYNNETKDIVRQRVKIDVHKEDNTYHRMI